MPKQSTMAWRRVGPGRWEYGVKQHGARWVQDGLELVRGKLHKKWVPEYKQPAGIGTHEHANTRRV